MKRMLNNSFQKEKSTVHYSKTLGNVTSYLGTQDIFSTTLIQTCNNTIPTEGHQLNDVTVFFNSEQVKPCI
jgi:hypothetical protein